MASVSPGMTQPALIHTLEGQVVWRRRYNAVFQVCDVAHAGSGDILEVLVSSGNWQAAASPEEARERCKSVMKQLLPGNIVRLACRDGEKPDGGCILLAHEVLQVVSTWRAEHPSVPFIPHLRMRPTAGSRFEAPDASASVGCAPPTDRPPTGTGTGGTPADVPSRAALEPSKAVYTTASTAAHAGLSSSVCKFFVNTGRCATRGCRFAHTYTPTSRGAWVDERRRLRRESAQVRAMFRHRCLDSTDRHAARRHDDARPGRIRTHHYSTHARHCLIRMPRAACARRWRARGRATHMRPPIKPRRLTERWPSPSGSWKPLAPTRSARAAACLTWRVAAVT